MKYLPTNMAIELKRKATDVLLVMQSLRHENLNPFIGDYQSYFSLKVLTYIYRTT